MAVPHSSWAILVRELMQEQGISERRLALTADVNRTTLRRWLQGQPARIPIDAVERILEHMGYELEALRRAA